ncbi:MAG: hypothetical protein Q4G68_13270 [Planctomycetia bacterium]|nr:hypothetical protein [Planctomycetia bacterium]
MKHWGSLFAGHTGIVAGLHELFGTAATIVYRTPGPYSAATDQQTVATREVPVSFIPEDHPLRDAPGENAHLHYKADIRGTIAAVDLDEVPVVHRDHFILNESEFVITEVTTGYAKGLTVVYRIEGKRL